MSDHPSVLPLKDGGSGQAEVGRDLSSPLLQEALPNHSHFFHGGLWQLPALCSFVSSCPLYPRHRMKRGCKSRPCLLLCDCEKGPILSESAEGGENFWGFAQLLLSWKRQDLQEAYRRVNLILESGVDLVMSI